MIKCFKKRSVEFSLFNSILFDDSAKMSNLEYPNLARGENLHLSSLILFFGKLLKLFHASFLKSTSHPGSKDLLFEKNSKKSEEVNCAFKFEFVEVDEFIT